MAGENKSSTTELSNHTIPGSPALDDSRIKLVQKISKLDCSAIPFSKLEVKVRDNGKPYCVVITRTYMIDSDGNVT